MSGRGAPRGRLKRVAASAAALVSALWACGLDPVHDGEVNALGPEQPGLNPGPTHRPGQPCLVCHGGSGPGGQTFSVGGTIYQSQTAVPPVGLLGGTVTLVDTKGSIQTATTNEVGNFYVLASSWTPAFPVHVKSVAYGGSATPMYTHIGRDASCASCHFDPRGPTTPGHVYLVVDAVDFPDGGAR